MYNSLTGRLTTSRGGAVLLGIVAALIAAILLTVYITHYRSSVKSGAAPATVLVAKRLIPAGTTGAEIGTKQIYTLSSVPKDRSRPARSPIQPALNGVIAATRRLPRSAADGERPDRQRHGDSRSPERRSSRRRSGQSSIQIDALNGNLANIRTGDHVDIYQQIAERLERHDHQALPFERAGAAGQAAGTTPQGSAAGQIVLGVPSRDSADLLYAAKHTELSFVLRPSSGATPTRAYDGEQPDDAPVLAAALARWRRTRSDTLVALDSGITAEAISKSLPSDGDIRLTGRRRGPRRRRAQPRGHPLRHPRRRLRRLLGPGAVPDRERRQPGPRSGRCSCSARGRRTASSAACSRSARTTS